MTLKVIRLLQDLSNEFDEHLCDTSHGINYTQRVARSLGDS